MTRFTPFRILDTDQCFTDGLHYEEGDPECTCSRCGLVIPEEEIAVRFWRQRPDDHGNVWTYRFHPACLGMRTFDDERA
jgi:hypothetical protein